MDDTLDSITTDSARLVIVGAGIAGLSAALAATGSGRRPLVIDAHGPGGRARTADRDGFLHNTGPHALYRAGALQALLNTHGITVSGGAPDAIRVRLQRDGVLTPLTMRPIDLLRTPLLGRRDRLRLMALLARVQRAEPASLIGRSVDDWLGDHPVRVRQFADMLIRVSTYTNAPATFDAGAALQQMQMALGDGVTYLDHGWGSMVAAMVEHIRAGGGRVVSGAEVQSVVVHDGHVQVTLADRALRADSVVVAAGGPALVERLTGVRPRSVDRLTPPVQAATLDLALRRPHPGLVFGLDRPLYQSPHAPTARLAPDGCGLVSVMQYVPLGGPASSGSGDGDRDTDRAELRSLALQSGIVDADIAHQQYSHRLTVVHGAPTAAGGGLAGRPTVDALDLPGVAIAGDWVGPHGLLADAAAASGAAAMLSLSSSGRTREHSA